MPEQWQTAFLDDLSDLSKRLEHEDGSRGLRGIFKDQLSVGGGESFSAEEHHGREVLELFQNAADKCRGKDRATSGAVYIALTENGLLVANTGEEFNFKEDDTRDALSIFGYTDKDETEVGKFGVGLTAIRATGEAYEVWTKREADERLPKESDCWRVRCGPENILAPIAQAFESTADTEPICHLRGELGEVTDREDLLPDPSETPDMKFGLNADEFPYFLRPLPLQDWRSYTGQTDDLNQLERRGEQLLTGEWKSSENSSMPQQVVSTLDKASIDSFTTAVFVEYENEAWRELFTGLSGERLPESADAKELHDQAWYTGREDSELTPELLITLGEAETVVVESWLTDTTDSEVQIWDVQAPCQSGGSHRRTVKSPVTLDTLEGDGLESTNTTDCEPIEVDLTSVQATLTTGFQLDQEKTKEHHEFWHVAFADGRTFDAIPWFEDPAPPTEESDLVGSAIGAQLLVPRKGSEYAYHTHLYYPISDLDTTFWACLHGEFAVQQDRQSLDGNATMQNACVIAELARLTGCAGEVLATEDAIDDWLASRMPWRLLPPEPASGEMVPSELVDEGRPGEAAVLDSLRASMATRLRTARAIPTTSGERAIADADASEPIGLTANLEVFAGLAALYELDTSLKGGDGHLLACSDTTTIDLLTKEAMAALADWLSDAPDEKSGGSSEHEDFPDTELDGFDPAHIAAGDTKRLERISYLLESTPEGISLDAWQSLLTNWADLHQDRVGESKTTTLPVREPSANAILDATMSLATPDGETGPETAKLNRFVPDEGTGAHLLPCADSNNSGTKRNSSTREDESVNLVYLEDHSGRSRSTREVLRPKTDESTGTVGTTPAATAFDIFVLTERTAERWEHSIKEANWGTTEHDGPLALFRSLLKSATHSETPLCGDDFSLLAARFAQIPDPPATGPGAYHSKEVVDAIVTASGSDQFDERFKTRLEARRATLSAALLTDSTDRIGRDVQFSDDCIESHESLPSELTDIAAPSDAPQTALSSAEDGVAVDMDDTVVQALSTVGVSPLPGIETIARYRDIDLNANGPWQPLDTDSWGDPDPDDDRVNNLKNALGGPGGQPPGYPDEDESPYCELVAAPGFNPSTSIEHTSHCSVKDYLADSGNTLESFPIMLATWVWMQPDQLGRLSPSELAPLLKHIGEEFAETVFTTAWSCSYGNGSPNGINQSIPTLLSWQLRCLPGWDRADEIDFYPPRQPAKGSEGSNWTAPESGWSLAYAVQNELEEETSGQPGVELLPTVNPTEPGNTHETGGISQKTLAGLGVKPVEELTAAEAAFRLQALLRANADLHDGDAAVLFGGEMPRGWKTLCEQLLKPVVAAVGDTGRGVTDLFPYLTHVPVRGLRGASEAWFALPVAKLANLAVYYETEASVWETRVEDLANNERTLYLLDGAPAGTKLDGFVKFAETHDVTLKHPEYPTIDASIPTTPASELRETLREFDYKTNILAAAPGRQAKQYDKRERRYDAAVGSLRSADQTEADVFGDREWAYQLLGEDTDSDAGIGIQDDSEVSAVSNRVRPVVEPDIDVDGLPAISGLFEALFQGGRSDSYKLALTGQDVDRVDEARRHLASKHHEVLRADLDTVASLLEADLKKISFEELDADGYETLRTVCAAKLHPTDTASGHKLEDVPADLEQLIETVTEKTDVEPYTLAFAAEWLETDERSARRQSLLKILREPPGDPDRDWKCQLLKRVNRWLGLNNYLPENCSRIRRFARLLTAISTETTLDTVPDQREFAWYESVTLDIEGQTPTGLEERSASVPDTWFELAWLAIDGDRELLTRDVIGSDLYEVVTAALADHIAGDDAEERAAIKAEFQRGIEGARQTSKSADRTRDAELYEQLEGTLTRAVDESGGLSALRDANSMRASRRSDDGGGMSNSTTVAPRAAELLALKSVYAGIDESDLTPGDVKDAVAKLREDAFLWHYDSTWENFPRLPEGSFPTPDELEALSETYIHALCDTAEEPIVGFDVLDLTGRLVPTDAPELDVGSAAVVKTDAYPGDINPVPVEVKCVSDPSQPRFRFTTNQVRRALRFVSDETGPQRPFLLQFIQLSRGDGGFNFEGSSARVLARPADVYDLLGIDASGEDDAIEELLTELVRSGHFQIT